MVPAPAQRVATACASSCVRFIKGAVQFSAAFFASMVPGWDASHPPIRPPAVPEDPDAAADGGRDEREGWAGAREGGGADEQARLLLRRRPAGVIGADGGGGQGGGGRAAETAEVAAVTGGSGSARGSRQRAGAEEVLLNQPALPWGRQEGVVRATSALRRREAGQ